MLAVQYRLLFANVFFALCKQSQPQLPRRLCPSPYLESRLLHHLVHTELMHILSILSPYLYPHYMPFPYGMTPYPYPPVPAPIPSDSKQKLSSKSSTSAAVSSTSPTVPPSTVKKRKWQKVDPQYLERFNAQTEAISFL